MVYKKQKETYLNNYIPNPTQHNSSIKIMSTPIILASHSLTNNKDIGCLSSRLTNNSSYPNISNNNSSYPNIFNNNSNYLNIFNNNSNYPNIFNNNNNYPNIFNNNSN